MAASTEDSTSESLPTLSDLDPPHPSPSISLTGRPIPPQQHLHFYSSDEWEDFMLEWAKGLDGDYVQIKRLGGSGDQGVDVAAFKTASGFEGPWDCYQGKHYADPLRFSDIAPEILKVLMHTAAGHYTLPDRYAFIAPRGCGTQLNRLLSRPSELRDLFLERLCASDDLTKGLTDEILGKIRALAEATDFSMFQSAEILDILETHRKTPYYTARFGGPLAARPTVSGPPEELNEIEVRYVEQLIDVYSERYPSEAFTAVDLSSDSTVGKHFRRQRFSFYSAEALRLYARDSVPEGTFEALQNDIYGGVIEVAESDHSSGMDRLTNVLTVSGALDLSSHTLISVSNMDDRKGMCHQLANEDRLNWMGQDNEDST